MLPTEKKRGDGLERRPPVGTAARSAAGVVPPITVRTRDSGSASLRLASTAERAVETAYCRPRRSAGTAWNADLRSAPLRAAPRASCHRSPSGPATAGAPVSDWHRPPRGGRNRVLPTEKKRGDGLERRPPVGTAARERRGRRTTDHRQDPRQRERQSPTGIDRREAVETACRPPRRSAGTAWNADLRSAPLRAAPRASYHRSPSGPATAGAPVSDWHRPPRGGRNRVLPTEKNRGDGLERRPPVGTAARSAANVVPPITVRTRDSGSASLRLASTAERRSKPRTADREESRGRLGTPTSGRHRCAQRRGRRTTDHRQDPRQRERQSPTGIDRREAVETAYCRPRRIAGTAWNADLRSAPLRAAPRASYHRSPSGPATAGAPVSDWHRPPRGGRNRVLPTEKKRGDGLERRPPVGTAARSAAGVVPLITVRTRDSGSASLRLASTAERRSKPRTANRDQARGRLGTPTSGRHRGAQRRGRRTTDHRQDPRQRERQSPTGIDRREAVETAYCPPRRIAGTAWNADLRSAPLRESAANGRT